MSASDWADARWKDFDDDGASAAIAVCPVAAIEQHGPHLPLGVDAFIMEGCLSRARQLVPADMDVRFLPLLAVGASGEHASFPGTLSLRPRTLLRVLTDIGASVRRAGCRKLLFVSSHGGNSAAIAIAALKLRRKHAMLAATVSWQRFGYPPGLFDEEEIAHGTHAGAIETSLMLAFRPELVRRQAIADFPPAGREMARAFAWLRPDRPAGFGWMAQDLSPSGAAGDASRASAEKGEACAAHAARAFVDLLKDMAAFGLDRLREGPLERPATGSSANLR